MLYRRLSSAFAVATLILTFSILTFSGPAYSFSGGGIMIPLSIPGSLRLCNDTDPTKGQIISDPDAGTIEQNFEGIICTVFDDDLELVGSGTFDFSWLAENLSVNQDDSTGDCITAYQGVCGVVDITATFEEQAGGAGLCDGALCFFENLDEQDVAKNDKQLATLCETLYPAEGVFPQGVKVLFDETQTGTCGGEGQINAGTKNARFCMVESGGECVVKVKGENILFVSNETAQAVVVADWEFQDKFNLNGGDNGNVTGVIYGNEGYSVLDLAGVLPFNANTAPKINGTVSPTDANVADFNNDGELDVKLFFASVDVRNELIDDVQPDGSLAVPVKGTLGTTVTIGIDIVQTNGN